MNKSDRDLILDVLEILKKMDARCTALELRADEIEAWKMKIETQRSPEWFGATNLNG